MSESMIPPVGKNKKSKKEEYRFDAQGNPINAETGATTGENTEGGDKPAAKARGPRQDYGYRKGATISITDKEVKYHGQRLEWFETLKSFNGQPVEAWEASQKGVVNNKGTAQSPRGWLRFFVLDGSVVLNAPAEAAEAAAA